MTKDDSLKQIKEAVKFLQENETAPSKPVKEYMAADIPKVGDKYFFMDDSSEIFNSIWDGFVSKYDFLRYEYGNVYLIKESAIKALDKQLATMRVLRKLRELEGDFVANFNHPIRCNCIVYFNHRDKVFYFDATLQNQYIPKSWHSNKKAWQYVIDNMTDDLKLMYEID